MVYKSEITQMKGAYKGEIVGAGRVYKGKIVELERVYNPHPPPMRAGERTPWGVPPAL